MVATWVGFGAGLILVLGTLMSVAGTLVVPRAVNSPVIAHLVEWFLDVTFLVITKPARTFERRDRILAWQAPMSLLVRLAVWLGMLVVGFALLLLPSLKGHLGQAFSEPDRRSSPLATRRRRPVTARRWSTWRVHRVGRDRTAGRLPADAVRRVQQARNRSHAARHAGGRAIVGTRALARSRWGIQDGDMAQVVETMFRSWERWAAEVAESHTTYFTLARFRSPRPLSHWLTSLIAVMDAAALHLAGGTVRPQPSLPPRLALRMGFVAISQIARTMGPARRRTSPAPMRQSR